MRKTTDLYTFGGRLHVREGWFWFPARPCDLERAAAEDRERADRVAFAAAAVVLLGAAVLAIVKEALA